MDGEDASVCRAADGLGEGSRGGSGTISVVRSFSSCNLRRFFSFVFLKRRSLSSSESTHEGFIPAAKHLSSRHFWQFFLDLRRRDARDLAFYHLTTLHDGSIASRQQG